MYIHRFLTLDLELVNFDEPMPYEQTELLGTTFYDWDRFMWGVASIFKNPCGKSQIYVPISTQGRPLFHNAVYLEPDFDARRFRQGANDGEVAYIPESRVRFLFDGHGAMVAVEAGMRAKIEEDYNLIDLCAGAEAIAPEKRGCPPARA